MVSKRTATYDSRVRTRCHTHRVVYTRFVNNNNTTPFVRVVFRIFGSRPPRPGPRYVVRGVQKQEMGLQLERERARTHHVQVLGAVRRPQKVAYRQGRIVSVQEHVPVGEWHDVVDRFGCTAVQTQHRP